MERVAIIGAGVSGLTCGVIFAEHGYRTVIIAEEVGQRTTSAAAGAIWFPYDAEPFVAVLEWSLETYKVLQELSRNHGTGVSMIELRTFSRSGRINIPDWARKLGARQLNASVAAVGESSTTLPPGFTSGFALNVPLTDTTLYLDYLTNRLIEAGGAIQAGTRIDKLENLDREFELLINCSGIGARELVPDPDLEPHRGQVAIVAKQDLAHAVVCDEPPLMYAIPRSNDCLLGGTNELSDQREADPAVTSRIVTECSRVLGIDEPRLLLEKVGLRPFRRSGICLGADRLRDGRAVVHNYGHGGSGFTLSWGCARAVFNLARETR